MVTVGSLQLSSVQTCFRDQVRVGSGLLMLLISQDAAGSIFAKYQVLMKQG